MEKIPLFEKGENPDKNIREELERAGWQYAGNEVTHMTPLNPVTGRFEPKEIKTAQEVETQFLDSFGSHGFDEVKLVRPHIEKGILGWVEDVRSYDVYMKKSEE